MLEKIEEPNKYEVIESDTVTSAHVYLGSFDALQKATLKQRPEPRLGEACFGDPTAGHVLTLPEITEQLKDQDPIITIFIDDALHGKILQYGNYGDSWWIIGEMAGYA